MSTPVARALRDALIALNEQIAATEATLARLKLERRGVTAACARFEGAQGSELPSGELLEDLPADNCGRVHQLLRKADRPLRVAIISEALSLSDVQTRTSLGYLHRKGLVSRATRGVWQAVKEEGSQDNA